MASVFRGDWLGFASAIRHLTLALEIDAFRIGPASIEKKQEGAQPAHPPQKIDGERGYLCIGSLIHKNYATNQKGGNPEIHPPSSLFNNYG
jgi:hypothetical protein